MAAPAAALIDGKKACSSCGVVKALEEFRAHPGGLGGRRSKCRVCDNAKSRAWQDANPEKHKAQKRRSWARHKERLNAERRASRDAEVLERERAWREANADTLRRQNREYRAAHPEKTREWHRRCRISGIPTLSPLTPMGVVPPYLARNHIRRMGAGVYGPELAAAIAVLRSQPCAYCGSIETIEIDHIIPLSRGGTNDVENLASACRACNRSKFNRTPDEWLGAVA